MGGPRFFRGRRLSASPMSRPRSIRDVDPLRRRWVGRGLFGTWIHCVADEFWKVYSGHLDLPRRGWVGRGLFQDVYPLGRRCVGRGLLGQSWIPCVARGWGEVYWGHVDPPRRRWVGHAARISVTPLGGDAADPRRPNRLHVSDRIIDRVQLVSHKPTFEGSNPPSGNRFFASFSFCCMKQETLNVCRKSHFFCFYCKIHACALVWENSFFMFSFVCRVGSVVPGRVLLVHEMYERCSAPARSKGTMWTVALSRILQPVRDANVGVCPLARRSVATRA
jgi:hypothetical protein